MSHLVISKKNEVYLNIEAEPHVYYELADQFTFEVPGAQFSPAYKNKYWDCLLYTSPSPRDGLLSRMPSSA